MKLFILFCFSILPLFVFAKPTLPSGCQAIPVLEEALSIKGKKRTLVFIHNLSKTDVWLTHPVQNPGASAGWNTRLQGGKWSALLVNKPFILNCVESTPGHEQQISCQGVIAACKWKKPIIPSGTNGSFWVGEDLSLKALIAAIGGRGFLVK